MEVSMLTRIFYDVDDFCQTFKLGFHSFLLETECKKHIVACL